MLSEKQYELIGRVTLYFNEMELTIAMFLPPLLGTQEYEVSELLVGNARQFVDKARLITQVLAALESHDQFSAVMPELFQRATEAIKRTEALALKRNSLVHGVVSPIWDGSFSKLEGYRILSLKNLNEIGSAEAELMTLSDEMSGHVDVLRAALHPLTTAISEARLNVPSETIWGARDWPSAAHSPPESHA